MYSSWRHKLPQEIEICPVQLPGRGGRIKEQAYCSLPEMLDSLMPALVPFLDRPYVMFGHSMGALISFETARRIKQYGHRNPSLLIVSAREAPQCAFSCYKERHLLNDDELIAELFELNGTPPGILGNRELMEILMHTVRADFALCETYAYDEAIPLECPIVGFGGIDDNTVTLEGLQQWKEQTTTYFSLHILPGDHFFLNSYESQLLKVVTEEIRRVIPLKAE